MIDNPYVIKTYRYLRLAMVGLVIFLLLAVLIEWWHTDPRCFQTTLSAYYYTPAQAVFVSALLAIGVCMVVLKGNTEIEDVLLNAAGMLAPVAALVPTPGVGDCWSTPVNPGNTPADVANNMTALLAISSVVLVAILFVANRAGWPPAARVGVPLAALLVVGFGVWFYVGRDSFLTGAHYVSAIALFVLIAVVVLINALRYRRQGDGTGLPKSVLDHRRADGVVRGRVRAAGLADTVAIRNPVARGRADRPVRHVLVDPDEGVVGRRAACDARRGRCLTTGSC